jgi:hypothetical protein
VRKEKGDSREGLNELVQLRKQVGLPKNEKKFGVSLICEP